jgi:MFS family permease
MWIRWKIIAMQSTTQRALSPARLCAFNAGIQLVWGAILAVSLQARSVELAQSEGVRAYALIAALGALVATLVQPLAGALSDRQRRRTGNRNVFYVTGLLIALPSLAWFYLAPSWPQLLAAFFVLEFGMNVAGGPYQAVIPDYVAPPKRGLFSSWMSAYQSVGNAAGLLVAGFVHDLRIVALALAAGLAGTWGATVAHLRGRSGSDADGESTPASLLRNGPLRALLLSRGLINVGFFTLLGFLLFYVRESLGVRGDAVQTQTALVFLSFTLAAVAGAAIAARPTDRMDKRVVVSVACGAIALSLAALAIAPALGFAYAAAVCAGAAWGAFVTADWALAAAVLPAGAMATAMGIWNVATTLPQVVAPLATAPLVLRFNAIAPGLGPRAAIVLSLCEFVAGGALIWRLPRA